MYNMPQAVQSTQRASNSYTYSHWRETFPMSLASISSKSRHYICIEYIIIKALVVDGGSQLSVTYVDTTELTATLRILGTACLPGYDSSL